MPRGKVYDAGMTDQNEPQDAARLAHLSLRGWWRVLGRVLAGADDKNIGVIAAGVGFYALLSIFPALAALIALWGYFADPAVLRDQLDVAQRLLPPDAFKILNDQVSALVSANRSTLQLTSLVSIGIAIWTARNGVAALIRGLNSMYRQNNRTNPISRYGLPIVLTLILILVGFFAFASVVVLPAILAFLPMTTGVGIGIFLGKWAVVLMVVFFGIALLYRYGTNRRAARVPWITPGAFVALVLWAAGSAAFSAYLRNFGSFNEVYGSLGAVVALLFWMYLSAYSVLFGAQLNAELELVTHKDTRVGRKARAGARDAPVVDQVKDSEGCARPAAPPGRADAG